MSLTFAYRARTPSGERVSGRMRALDRASALTTLRDRMLVPSKLESTATTFSIGRSFARARPKERLAFFRAYAALEQSGVDFSTAFALLIAQARTPSFREALESIKSDVERGGEKLYAAMSHRPDEFSDLEVAMVAAGEEAGNREDVFDRLAAFLERDERTRKRLQSALFYPAIVCVAALGVTVYLFAVIVPQFGRLFDQFGVTQSPAMSAMLALGALLADSRTIAAAIAVAFLGALAVTRGLRTSDGALFFDRLRQGIPLVGEAVRKSVLARLSRVLATLLQSGVNQVRALEVAVPVAESPIFAAALESARERLATGVSASLEDALALTGVFEPLFIGFVNVGSHAGNIPQMLVKLSEYYEEDVESLLSALPTLVQTIVTIGLGAVVAVIIYVVYVPLSSLSSSIH